jgi:hypothetical protein
MRDTVKLPAVFLYFAFFLLVCGCREAYCEYVDPHGRFAVNVPGDWKVQDSGNDIRSKTAFHDNENVIAVISESYMESDTVTEIEKEKVRTGFGADIKNRLGPDVANISEDSLSVDDARAWAYSFDMPDSNMRYKLILFIKNEKLYNISAMYKPKFTREFEAFLKNFQSR